MIVLVENERERSGASPTAESTGQPTVDSH